MNKLESGEAGDPNEDVDEVIEASELVHNAIKEIRNALLMNRNPEDVDSDNEYEDGEVLPIFDFVSIYRSFGHSSLLYISHHYRRIPMVILLDGIWKGRIAKMNVARYDYLV